MMNIFMFAAAFIITYAFYTYKNYSDISLLQKLSFIGIFTFSLVLFAFMFYRAVEPRDWDFTCFYLTGKVAASGLDVYNPSHYYSVLAGANIPIELDAGFKSEFIELGSLYPPPTTLLFLPLGYMTYMQGLYFFYGLILLAFIGCLYQIKVTFFNNADWKGWFLVCALSMLTVTFYSVINYAQTLIFELFFFILIYKNKEKRISGLYLAISIFIKPFAAIFFLYFLVKKRWNIVIAFILSTLGIVLVTMLFFGYQPFIDYIFNNPSQRFPDLAFLEETNQSMFAILFRIFNGAAIGRIIFYVLTCVFILLSAILAYQLNKTKKFDVLFPLLLSLALIIYPSALYHYAVVHILSLLILLKYIKNEKLLYLFIFGFFMSLLGRIFYLNVYLFIVCSLIAFEEYTLPYFQKNILIKRLVS